MSAGKKIKGGLRFAAAALVSLIRAPISFALSAATLVLGVLGVLCSAITVIPLNLNLGSWIVCGAIMVVGLPLRALAFAIDSVNYYLLGKPLYSIAGANVFSAYSRLLLSCLEGGCDSFLGRYYDDRGADLMEGPETWYAKGIMEVSTGEDYNLEAWEEMRANMFRSKGEKEPDTEHEGRNSESELPSKEYTETEEAVDKPYASDELKSQRPGSNGPPEAQKSDDGIGPGRHS